MKELGRLFSHCAIGSRTSLLTIICLAGLSLRFSIAAEPQRQVKYTITDLGTLPGTASCQALALSDNGKVVGTCSPDASGVGPRRGFIWENGVITDLGGLPGYPHTHPVAVNNHDQVVGYVDDVQSTRPFLWTNGIMSDLNDLLPANSGWDLTSASDINDAGQIIGGGYHNGIRRAYLFDGIQILDLGTLGGSSSGAGGINELGTVVGSAETENGESHAFIWQNGVMTRIGPFDGEFSYATDINDLGVVVGGFGSFDENPPLPPKVESRFPFRWQNGVITQLDSADLDLPSVVAINNLSQAVGSGTRFDGFFFEVAVLWQGSERHELYDLIPPDGQWQIGMGRAEGINKTGQIVGYSWTAPSDGHQHAYLLTPLQVIPTISEWGMLTLACFLLGLGCVIIARVRGSPPGNRDVPESKV